MAAGPPGPSNAGTRLIPAAAARQLARPGIPQPGGRQPHYSVLLSTSS